MACPCGDVAGARFRAVRACFVVLLLRRSQGYGIGWARNLTSPVWGVRSIRLVDPGTLLEKARECGQGAVWRDEEASAQLGKWRLESAQRRQRGGADYKTLVDSQKESVRIGDSRPVHEAITYR